MGLMPARYLGEKEQKRGNNPRAHIDLSDRLLISKFLETKTEMEGRCTSPSTQGPLFDPAQCYIPRYFISVAHPSAVHSKNARSARSSRALVRPHVVYFCRSGEGQSPKGCTWAKGDHLRGTCIRRQGTGRKRRSCRCDRDL